MATDLKLCIDAMKAKAPAHAARWRYYDGDHPISFLNPKFDEVIRNGVVFKKNWCQVIVNATRDRLKVQSWDAADTATAERAARIWKRSLKRCAASVHTSVLTCGEAFIVAWPDARRNAAAYYHDPRQVAVLYEDNDPNTPRVACKRWSVGERQFLNLYYPDVIQHYKGQHDTFIWTGDDVNPFGQIPVFHFRGSQRALTGELTTGILSLQDSMNKILNDMMVSSEFCSFPQRWAIGQWEPGPVSSGPGTILKIPSAESGEQPSSVGTFATTDAKNFLAPMDSIAQDMGTLSGTPKHYFSGSTANLSGEALRALEAPLIAKAELYQESLGETWAQVMAFCLTIEGATVYPEDVEPIWQQPHTQQPKSLAETRLINTQAGIPLLNILRDEGWTEKQLQQLQADAAALPAPAQPGPRGTIEDQAAQQQVTVERQATSIRAALLTALEAVNVDMVDRLVKNGTLDRMKAARPGAA